MRRAGTRTRTHAPARAFWEVSQWTCLQVHFADRFKRTRGPRAAWPRFSLRIGVTKFTSMMCHTYGVAGSAFCHPAGALRARPLQGCAPRRASMGRTARLAVLQYTTPRPFCGGTTVPCRAQTYRRRRPARRGGCGAAAGPPWSHRQAARIPGKVPGGTAGAAAGERASSRARVLLLFFLPAGFRVLGFQGPGT